MVVKKLTESLVRNLPLLAAKGSLLVYEQMLTGFGVRVTMSKKCFFAEGRLNRKTRRVAIGGYPLFTVEKARKEAQVILSELIRGIDRAAVEEEAAAKAVTLDEAYAIFKDARKSLRPSTVRGYDWVMENVLAEWQQKPWITINPMMVLKRHGEIGKENGPALANQSMRVLSAVIRFAMSYWSDAEGNPPIAHCPTAILSKTNAWFKVAPRERVIKPLQLTAWWAAVQALENKVAADFFTLLLLTGLRRSEAAGLKWEDVDLDHRTITVRQTKNGTTHVLPIPDFLLSLLKRRKDASTSGFVFPGPGNEGHLVEVKRNVAAVVKQSGVEFTSHDLRRSFATIADGLEISSNAVKRLLNHSASGDVTLIHYIKVDVERLRTPMQRIEDFILKSAGVLQSAEVVPLQQKQA